MVRIWSSTEGARKIESWGPGMTRQGRRRSGWRVSRVQGFQGGLPQGGPRVLVLYQEGFPAVSRRFVAQFQGIPSGVTQYKFPRRRQRRSWRPGIIPGAGMGVVLEAWCYTRVGGPGVVHTAAARFQGIPELCSSVQIPQMKRWRDLYQKQQGALIPARLRHLYQGSVGDGRRWITGIQGSHGVIDFFVYTSSILVPCLYCYLSINCLY